MGAEHYALSLTARAFVIAGGDRVAKATITHQFADGTAVKCEVSAKANYPDVLAELEARCLALYRASCVDEVGES